MRYGIVGVGAIGGFYGGKLAYSDQEVHFLTHSDYEFVRDNGLQVDSCDGSFHIDKVHAYRSSADMPKCDVVIVGLKTTNNRLLRELLPPLLHEESAVVLIQNGIGVEADVQAMFPDLQLIAGLAFICSAKSGPGRVSHQCYGSINLANYSCRDESLFRAVLNDFTRAGIAAATVPYDEARWKKAVWNMPFNGMTVALNTRTDLLLKHPATRQLIRDLMMEVVEASRAVGVTGVDEAFVEKMIDMTDSMTPYSPSMKLDFDYRRPMEIHYLYTRPIEIARAAGYRMRKLEMLEAELRFLQDNYDTPPEH